MNLDTNPRATAQIPLPADAVVLGLRLSRSNLETLLAKCGEEGSAATLLRQIWDDPKIVVVLKAEEDAVHYNSEARQEDVRGTRGAMLEDGATGLGQFIRVPAELDPADGA